MFYIYIQLLIFFDPLENLYSRALIKNIFFFEDTSALHFYTR